MADESIAEVNRRAWNKIAVAGKNVNPYGESKKQKELFDQFVRGLPRGGKVLDLGCGTGVPVGEKLIKRGFDLVGVDVSDEMVVRAKKNVPGGSFLRVSMGEIEWVREFDGVVSSFSMLCLPPEDFGLVAGKVVRALKRNGLFLLFLNEAVGDDKGRIETVMGERLFSRGIAEREVRETFERLGMRVVRLEREVVRTREYGVEHTMLFLMRKER